jgi:hypothetical protein
MSGFDPILLAVVAVFALVLFTVIWAGMGVTRAREDMANRLELYGRQTVGAPATTSWPNPSPSGPSARSSSVSATSSNASPRSAIWRRSSAS